MTLTDLAIRTKKPADKPYKVSDSRGLYLLIAPAGGKYWRFDYRFQGRRGTLALGVYPDVSLAAARELHAEARRKVKAGIDPAAAKRAEKLSRQGADTFQTIALEWIDRRAPTLSPDTVKITRRALERDIYPFLGSRPINTIAAHELLRVLRRIEARGAGNSAHRMLRVCGQILRYAIATGRADRDIAADLKGALASVVEGHFAAVTDPVEIGGLLRMIDGYSGSLTVRCALRLAPLVFVRPSELRMMRWEDVDLDASEWRYTVNKTRTQHIVPLSRQAREIIVELHHVTGNGPYVFPGQSRPNGHLSENALTGALRRLGIEPSVMTTHGWRAVARTLLDEALGFAPHLVEHQLAHSVKDPMGRSYNRTAHLQDRRAMMQQWSDYLDELRNPDSNVVGFRSSGRGKA